MLGNDFGAVIFRLKIFRGRNAGGLYLGGKGSASCVTSVGATVSGTGHGESIEGAKGGRYMVGQRRGAAFNHTPHAARA